MGRSQMRALLHTHEQTRAGPTPNTATFATSNGSSACVKPRLTNYLTEGRSAASCFEKIRQALAGRGSSSFKSVREYLASLESTGDAAPKFDGARKAVAARMEKAAARDAYNRGAASNVR